MALKALPRRLRRPHRERVLLLALPAAERVPRAWRNLRDQILARDHYTCQRCGAPAEHVDHVTAVAAGGADQPANLQALCRDCNLNTADH